MVLGLIVVGVFLFVAVLRVAVAIEKAAETTAAEMRRKRRREFEARRKAVNPFYMGEPRSTSVTAPLTPYERMSTSAIEERRIGSLGGDDI